MAKATVVYAEQPPIEKVVLELTEDEAQVLYALIGGCDASSAHVMDIFDAFADAFDTLERKYDVDTYVAEPKHYLKLVPR